MKSTPLLTLLVLLLLGLPAHAADAPQIGFRLELPQRYDVELHVTPKGSERGDGTESKPFGSISQALRYVAQPNSPLSKGRTTRINVAPGTYRESFLHDDWGAAAETLLAIEGQGPPNDVVLRPTADHPADLAYLWIEGKSSLVVRNLAFTESVDHNRGGTLRSYSRHNVRPETPMNDWLIENCVFRDGKGRGITLQMVDHVTIRNCKFHELEDTGMAYVGKASLFEDIEIYNTNTKGKGGFNTGGTSLLIADCVFRRVHIHDIPRGAGFRQDHGGENILIEDSIFERCQQWGVRLETAKGPVTIRNSVIRENGEAGMYTDAGEMTVTNCVIVDNPVGIKFQSGERYNVQNCVPPGYGCVGSKVDVGPGERVTNELPLFGVERVTLLNNTIVSPGNKGMVIELPGDQEFWGNVLPEHWHSHNNVYWAPENRDAFKSPQGVVAIQAWQKAVGGDAWFGKPEDAPAGYGAKLLRSEETSPVRFGRSMLDVEPNGGRETVQVQVPAGQKWTVRSTRDWLEVSPHEGVGPGEVTVTVPKNPLRARRGGALVLDADGQAWDLMVQQHVSALAGPTPPPTNIRIEKPGERDAVVTWSAAPGDQVFGYGVNFREPRGVWQKGDFAPANDRQSRIRGLRPGTEYEVRVRTIATDGVSGEDDGIIAFKTAGEADPCEIVIDPHFDGATAAAWLTRGAEKVRFQQEQTHSPGGALAVELGANGNGGARTDVRPGVLTHGPGTYRATAHVRVPRGEGRYYLRLLVRTAAGNQWLDITEQQVISEKDGWVKLEGTIDIASASGLAQVYLDVLSGRGKSPDFLVDDVSFQKVGCGK